MELKGHSDDTEDKATNIHYYCIFICCFCFGVKSINYNGNTQQRKLGEEKRKKKKEICMFSKQQKIKKRKNKTFWIVSV